MAQIVKLGTRNSVLAKAQSAQIAHEIQKRNRGYKIELVEIETEGDKIEDVPLTEVEGKDFFVKEIDQALIAGKIDIAVHSLKDLSLKRPEEITVAAIPRRENPRDIVVFNKEVISKLKEGQTLKIGTSSPRRIEIIPNFLKRVLPQFDDHTSVDLEMIPIRGNVDTRLKRLHATEESKKLDGVILALAGLSRLLRTNNENQRNEIHKSLEETLFMVLPLNHCPTAPGQGALAIECLVSNHKIWKAVNRIHDRRTALQIKAERQVLVEHGGGCHQKFGATQTYQRELRNVFHVIGKNEKGATIDQHQWTSPAPLRTPPDMDAIWDGTEWRDRIVETLNFDPLSDQSSLQGAVFVSHWRCLLNGWKNILKENYRVWTSGVSSWEHLAKMGIWVEGCAEGLGFDFIKPTLENLALQLPYFDNWTVVTHDSGLKSWPTMKAISTYKMLNKEDLEAIENAKKASYFFWSSGSQFDAMKGYISERAHHSCGPGKTANHLRGSKVQRLRVFPTVEEWRKWLNSN